MLGLFGRGISANGLNVYLANIPLVVIIIDALGCGTERLRTSCFYLLNYMQGSVESALCLVPLV